MIVFHNGCYVPAEQAAISVFDRGFLYGDGLFETTRVHLGQPHFWDRHIARLNRGAAHLQIPLCYTKTEIIDFTTDLITKNNLPESVLRLNLSRGIGTRGYSIEGCSSPTLVMSLHPPTAGKPSANGLRLITASQRLLADDPLASFKTTNKLLHILARAESQAAGADDALLFNTRGEPAEATASNLFWIDVETLCTPPLSSGALDGITRRVVLELCAQLGIAARETVAQIPANSAAFLTNSVQGIVDVASLDDRPLLRSPLVDRIRDAYQELTQQQASKCP